MTVILQDPVRPRDPSAGHAFPQPNSEDRATVDPPRPIAEDLLAGFRTGRMVGETTFELESHGGYARTVTGTVAYLDQEANTFMVRALDGKLARVPLRDVRSTHDSASGQRDELHPSPAARSAARGSRQRSIRAGDEAELFFQDSRGRSDRFFSSEAEPSQL